MAFYRILQKLLMKGNEIREIRILVSVEVLALSQHVVVQASGYGVSDCAQIMSVLGRFAWSRDRW